MKTQESSGKWAGTGLLVAITASLCCITPVLALLAGTSGIAATFSFLEPARPYLIGLTIAVLGFAWYQKLKPVNAEATGIIKKTESPTMKRAEAQDKSECSPSTGPISGMSMAFGVAHWITIRNSA